MVSGHTKSTSLKSGLFFEHLAQARPMPRQFHERRCHKYSLMDWNIYDLVKSYKWLCRDVQKRRMKSTPKKAFRNKVCTRTYKYISGLIYISLMLYVSLVLLPTDLPPEPL